MGRPIVWRILRINDDDSVTLILDHYYLSDMGNDVVLQGVKFSDDGSTKYEESKAKQYLDEFYNTIFTDEEQAMIQETEFCNDTNGTKVLDRLNKDNPKPTLECSEENKVRANIGLITADEAILAGGLYEKLTYSENSSIRTWTMTATSGSSMACAIESSLYPYEATSSDNNNCDILPIITVKPETQLLDSFTYNGFTSPSRYGVYVIGPEE